MNSVSAILKLLQSKRTHSVLCLFVAVFIVIPIPFVSIDRGKSDTEISTERFPCENSPCGCRSAQHCWTKCCCRTPKQRAEWAKANNVTPPSYAIVADESPVIASKSPACCAKEPKPSAVTNCCTQKNESTKIVANQVRKDKQRLSIQLTLTALVMNCHGQSSDFALMPWTTLVKPMSLGLNLPSIDTLGIPNAQQPFSVYYDPAVPPPRRAS
jgi:hypothetical protein